MAIVETKAIVVSSLKYGDTSLITRLYTEELGLQSFMLKGVLKSKKGKLKPAYFQPLNLLKIQCSVQPNRSLHSIREVQISHPYNSLPFDIVKQSIVLFLSEILNSSIQEQESNKGLYNFLENSFLWLDTHSSITNFHLLFLLNLTRYLGFYPDVNLDDAIGFDLVQGEFVSKPSSLELVKGDDFFVFKRLLGINFDRIESTSFNKNERQAILKILIRYYELHLDGFRTPKSLSVLETVFSR